MKKHNIFKIVLALVLCVAMVLPCVPIQVSGAAVNNFDVGSDFSGLNLSIIGDSISTFDGYSNNATYNPLYLTTTNATFNPYYDDDNANKTDRAHIAVGDTWWMQTAESLGMNLLVNNSWSGSRVLVDYADGQTTLGNNGDYYESDGTTLAYDAAGYKDRCINLHKGTTMPDIIAVFLGTNDVNHGLTTDGTYTNVGSKTEIDSASERSALYTSLSSYKTPTSSVQAYYIMISKMVDKYPDADIYLMTPMRHLNAMGGKSDLLTNFNAAVRYIVDVFQDAGEKVYLADLNKDCGITSDAVVKDYYYLNNLHPDTAGMDAISSCLLSEILEHSTQGKDTATTYEVSYDLDQAFVTSGLARRAVKGKPFSVDLLPYEDYLDIEFTVTMNGEDVTGAATTGDSIYIDSVTGPITITATADKNDFYYWYATNDDLASVYGDTYSYNHATLVGKGDSYVSGNLYTGTDADGDGTYVGNMNYIYYSLEEKVVLRNDKPWVVEFKMDSLKAGTLLLSETEASATDGNRFIFLASGSTTYDLVMLGTRNGTDSLYENYGAEVPEGILYGSTPYIYRLYNVIADDGSNMVYVSVGTDSNSMSEGKPLTNHYHGTTPQATGDTWINGKDFEFNFMGTTAHEIAANFEYIKVWENGVAPDAKTEFNDYRWELNETRDGFVSVDDDEDFTENYLTPLSGSIANGVFTETHFGLDDEVVLMHDQPWDMEWVSEGSWKDTNTGAMLFGTSSYYKGSNAPYLYRRHSSEFIAFGQWDDGKHHNYGIKLSDYGIDGTVRHTYRLSNKVNADGSNMVYLYVDDVEIGALDNYYVGGSNQKTKSDWISGKDFVFSYIGVSAFPIGNCELEYLQVWERGSYEYTLDYERLEQMVDEQFKNSIHNTTTTYTTASWNAYSTALTEAKTLLNSLSSATTQAQIDAAIEKLQNTQNQLVTTSSSKDKILSAELVTGEYSRKGKQTGLRVVTTPDVAALRIGSQDLIVCTSQVQVLEIDGKNTLVKVWLITFERTSTSNGTDVLYGIRAYLDLEDVILDDAAVAASKKAADAVREDDNFSVYLDFK